MADVSSRARARSALSSAALVFLLAFLAHSANAPSVWKGGTPQIDPFDDLYHAKRILEAAQHPGRVTGFDPNRGIHGAFCPWPPLYDAAAGAAAWASGATTPTGVLARAVWLPPLAASILAAMVAAWLAWRSGTFAGFLAGAGVALSFSYLDASRVGDIDHHFLEPPLLFGIIASTVLLRRARGMGDAIRYGALFGAALIAAIFVQTALLLAAGLALIAILLFDRGAVSNRWAGALGFALATGSVLIYRWAQPGGYPDDAWYLGLPHAAALLAAAVGCAVSAMTTARWPRATVFWTALCVGGLAAAAVPSAIAGMVGGLGFFGADPWLRTIVEFQPVFYQGRTGIWDGLCKLGGGALFVLPFGIAAFRRGETTRSVLALFGAAYLLAGLGSMRFLVCAGPLLAVIGAIVVARWGERPFLAALGSLVLLGPSLWIAAPTLREPAPPWTAEALPFFRAAEWLRKANSETQHVLAPWTWGHVFEVAGGQAPVVDGFGSWIGQTDFENALGAVLLAREDHVAAYCRSNAIRYVVLENPLRRLTVQAQAIGVSPDFYVRASEKGPTQILPPMRFSFWWRAYFDRGSEIQEPTRFAPAFRHFRLAYADPQMSEEGSRFRGPAVQVWERIDSER